MKTDIELKFLLRADEWTEEDIEKIKYRLNEAMQKIMNDYIKEKELTKWKKDKTCGSCVFKNYQEHSAHNDRWDTCDCKKYKKELTYSKFNYARLPECLDNFSKIVIGDNGELIYEKVEA